MTLLSTARKVMGYAKSPKVVAKKIYEELSALDVRTTALEAGTLITTDRYAFVRIPADAAASDTWERAIFKAQAGLTLKDVFVIPDTGIGQATNYMTLDVQNKGVGGAETTSLGSRAVNSSNTMAAMVGADLVTTNATLITDQVVSLKKTVTSAGQAFPGGLAVVKYTLT